MYPEPVEPVSHARRALIGLIQSRRFTATLAGWGMGKSVITTAYQMAVGRRRPSYVVIYALREHIRPELWYYDEAEKPLAPVKAAYLHSLAGKRKAALKKKILQDETAALGVLREIREKRGLPAYARRYGVKYLDLWQVCSKRKKAGGRYGYHQRPPYRVVRALREAIHPALWYAFPDELAAPQ
jgi:hypothetical protein